MENNETLARIDENVKHIKEQLNKYPLPELYEKIKNINNELIEHKKIHWMVFTLIVSGVLAVTTVVIKYLT